MVRGSTPKIIMGIGCQVRSHILGISTHPPRAFRVNLILTHTKDFCGKNGHKKLSPHFENYIKWPNFYNRFKQVAKI
jgi:hypothetical protein